MQRVENCKCDSIPKGMRENYTIFTRSQVFYCEQVHLSVEGGALHQPIFPIFFYIFRAIRPLSRLFSCVLQAESSFRNWPEQHGKFNEIRKVWQKQFKLVCRWSRFFPTDFILFIFAESSRLNFILLQNQEIAISALQIKFIYYSTFKAINSPSFD